MGIYSIAISDKGLELAQRLSKLTGGDIEAVRCDEAELFKWTGEHFVSGGAIIFVGEVGMAVRAIAPFLKQRAVDSSILVVDQRGKFVIPLLSGDAGKANALAAALADCLGSTAVITSAPVTDNVFAVDDWAASIGLKIANPEKVEGISAKLENGGTVRFSSVFPIGGALPEGLTLVPDDEPCDFTISYLSGVGKNVLCLVPPVLNLGIDCPESSTREQLEEAYKSFMSGCGCSELAVCQVCSIDSAASCKGLSEFCSARRLPLRLFAADVLRSALGDFSPSDIFEQASEAENICERSAVLGCSGNLLARKTEYKGITMALAVREPKSGASAPQK